MRFQRLIVTVCITAPIMLFARTGESEAANTAPNVTKSGVCITSVIDYGAIPNVRLFAQNHVRGVFEEPRRVT